ncbi:hypothetical protein I4U23_022183 [Adineta vaga]|nr:hypothetical protein I4U23_022183 [Adineta vaga]
MKRWKANKEKVSLTNGDSQETDYDQTLMTKSGHYLDYFYASHTPPPKTLNSCDFKLSSSSCTNDLVSLSEYLYQWSILNTTDGVKVQTGAPPMDYTFRNASGHYALLPGPKNGYIGYLHLPKTTSNYIERIILLKFSVL